MFQIGFHEDHPLDDMSIRLVQGTIGLYFIYLVKLSINYPVATSRLIYIGMSESKQNSIGSRLRGHRTGGSGNLAIKNYAVCHEVRFTFHSVDVLKVLGTENVLELESFFLKDFMSNFGAYPICNGQAGASFPATTLASTNISVDWAFFCC
jgi:hypothetical protein